MNFIPLSVHEMERSFFSGVYFAVWNTYEDRNHFHFLDYDGTWYTTKYSKKLEELFPVIKKLKWSKRGWEDWTWYYMGMGGGAVFVHKFILDAYKKYAGIDDKHIEYGPDYNAALKALEDLKNRRADRFTCHPGDFIVCESEVKFMNEKKSADYKKLVADMQKKYPVYTSKITTNFPKGTSPKGDPSAREIVKKFAAAFADKNDFYKTLKNFGLTWMEVDNPAIYEMRAKEALRIAVENGFDPFNVVTSKDQPLKLFAPVMNGENICQEINFYTYWQGFGYAEKTPKIKYLLVAQDWGNLNLSQDFIDSIKKWNIGDRTPLYFEKPTGIGTDTNLFELFKILGYDLSKRHDDLFFTNFCLGYRSANTKTVGGMTKKLMMNDAEEFKRLCDILEPENILCLGRLTSECVYESLTGKSFTDIYKDSKSYNDFLGNHEEIFAQCGSIESKIFPLAHCGYMGSMARQKGLPKQENPLYYQIEDWKKILKPDEKVKKTEQPTIKRTALYGAILGDIIGSPYEFDSDVDGVRKTKDFIFFKGDVGFTDDSVMTIAVAEALLEVGRNADDETVCSSAVIKSMRKWGRKYPYAGYAKKFHRWLETDNPQPYNSFGNGSAMRVSAAGWLYNSMFDTRECARMTAKVSHNHPEGMKGALATASAIFLARKGATKDEIRNYIEYEFGYNLNRTLDEIRPTYHHDGSCQGTVPEAIIAFLESTDFEDAIRNAVSLGGDADTLTCITGSIAEAFYGVPENLIEKCREYLPKEILDVVDKFNACKGYILDELENDLLENKIAEYNRNPSEKNLQMVHEEILNMLIKNYESKELIGFFTLGDMKIDDNGREGYYPVYVNKNGFDYEVLYTNTAEMLKYTKIGKYSEVGIVEIKEIFRVFDEVFQGKDYDLAINPYGENPFFLSNDTLGEILEEFRHKIRQEVQQDLSNDLSTEDDMKNLTVNMESGISKFELPKSIMTYCRADISLLDYFEKIFESGGIVFDAGFTTTTMLKIGSTENELEIKIIVPKGVGYGAYIAPMSIAPEECEFVLNRGTFFKVRKVDRENSQVTIEVVGRSPKELD